MVDRAQRQRRLRRLVAGAVVAAALVVAGVTGTLWWRSEAAREQAKAEALRAEAGKLLALARGEIDRYPTAALAYVRRSLDLADTPDARRFAVEVLWRGPVARMFAPPLVAGGMGYEGYDEIAISPDGRWLAGQSALGRLILVPWDGGSPARSPRRSRGTPPASASGRRATCSWREAPGRAFVSSPCRTSRRSGAWSWEPGAWGSESRGNGSSR